MSAPSSRFVFKALPVFGTGGFWFSEHVEMRDPRFRAAWRVYTESFSDFEQRSSLDQRRIHGNPNYRFSAILQGEEVVGVLACWALTGFWFVEHLAISSRSRSAGYGGRAVALLLEHVGGPVVLDVEPLGADLPSARRVAFYERQGFRYCGESVTLPPYAGKRGGLSNLMAWPFELDRRARERVLSAIEREVYGMKSLRPHHTAV